MEAGTLATAYRSGNADALYKAAGYDSSQRLCGNDFLHRVWITSTDALNIACAWWVPRKPGWLDIRGAGKTR